MKGIGPDIETVDILTVFDDAGLDLQHGGWAIKCFAALGSPFEQVMVLDADAIFLQAPEAILEYHSGTSQREPFFSMTVSFDKADLRNVMNGGRNS